MAAKKQPGTAVVDWEKEMAAQADLAAAAQRAVGAGGNFISFRAGQMSLGGEPLPGNMAAVVVLGHVMENSYFDTPFDADTPASPKCFAFAQNEEDLEPHSEVDNNDYFERQSDACAGCPQNEWGSARTGRGKACSNVMRLALISAGAYRSKGGRNAGFELEIFEDPEHFEKAEIFYAKIPVMSVRNFASFTKGVATDLRRPPHGVIAQMALEPDPKSQFRIVWEVIDEVPNDIIPIVMQRHKKAMEGIDFPYQPPMTPEPAKSNNKLQKRRK